MDGMDMGGGSHSGGMDMGGMGDMGGGCSMSMNMLFNWQTVGTCLLSPSWHITDKGKFAGSCIGLAFWAMLTELIRRWAREYDRYIIAEATRSLILEQEKHPAEFAQRHHLGHFSRQQDLYKSLEPQSRPARFLSAIFNPAYALNPHALQLRPTLIQQVIRSVLYAIQFTSAYLIMLVVMSFNAYVFISVVLGTLIGHFIATWDTLGTLSSGTIGCTPHGVQGAGSFPQRDSGSRGSMATINHSMPSKLPEPMTETSLGTGLATGGETATIPAPPIDIARYEPSRAAEAEKADSYADPHASLY